jgi:hypothetical protein
VFLPGRCHSVEEDGTDILTLAPRPANQALQGLKIARFWTGTKGDEQSCDERARRPQEIRHTKKRGPLPQVPLNLSFIWRSRPRKRFTQVNGSVTNH